VSRPRALLKSATQGLRDWRSVTAIATTTVRKASGAPERPLELAVTHLPRVGPVRSNLPNGATLRLWSKADDFVSNQVSARLIGYEPETSPLFYALAETARTTLDLGAHVGFYSLLAALANPHGTVFAFEPSRGALERPRRQVRINRLDNVTCVDAAVSDQDGTALFLEPLVHIPCSAGLSEAQMSWHDEFRKWEVRTVTLDSFLKERQVGPVDVVKLDVEGTEAQALRGMAVTLIRDRPSIVCEVLPGDQRGEELEALLCPLGYLLYHLTPEGPLPARDIRGHPEWLNYQFTALDPNNTRRLFEHARELARRKAPRR
jgi:FkbM family methyltransferase